MFGHKKEENHSENTLLPILHAAEAMNIAIIETKLPIKQAELREIEFSNKTQKKTLITDKTFARQSSKANFSAYFNILAKDENNVFYGWKENSFEVLKGLYYFVIVKNHHNQLELRLDKSGTRWGHYYLGIDLEYYLKNKATAHDNQLVNPTINKVVAAGEAIFELKERAGKKYGDKVIINNQSGTFHPDPSKKDLSEIIESEIKAIRSFEVFNHPGSSIFMAYDEIKGLHQTVLHKPNTSLRRVGTSPDELKNHNFKENTNHSARINPATRIFSEKISNKKETKLTEKNKEDLNLSMQPLNIKK